MARTLSMLPSMIYAASEGRKFAAETLQLPDVRGLLLIGPERKRGPVTSTAATPSPAAHGRDTLGFCLLFAERSAALTGGHPPSGGRQLEGRRA